MRERSLASLLFEIHGDVHCITRMAPTCSAFTSVFEDDLSSCAPSQMARSEPSLMNVPLPE